MVALGLISYHASCLNIIEHFTWCTLMNTLYMKTSCYVSAAGSLWHAYLLLWICKKNYNFLKIYILRNNPQYFKEKLNYKAKFLIS